MSLHVGGRIGTTKRPIISPTNLRVLAYEIAAVTNPAPHFLLTADIREFGALGLIVNDADELVVKGDVIKLDTAIDLNFPLIGMHVIDEDGKKLGKVSGYTLETDRFEIQQLAVERGIFKSLTDTGLLIHRSQITEINDKHIVVKSTKKSITQPVHEQDRTMFVNPFRTAQAPQPDSSSATSL